MSEIKNDATVPVVQPTMVGAFKATLVLKPVNTEAVVKAWEVLSPVLDSIVAEQKTKAEAAVKAETDAKKKLPLRVRVTAIGNVSASIVELDTLAADAKLPLAEDNFLCAFGSETSRKKFAESLVAAGSFKTLDEATKTLFPQIIVANSDPKLKDLYKAYVSSLGAYNEALEHNAALEGITKTTDALAANKKLDAMLAEGVTKFGIADAKKSEFVEWFVTGIHAANLTSKNSGSSEERGEGRGDSVVTIISSNAKIACKELKWTEIMSTLHTNGINVAIKPLAEVIDGKLVLAGQKTSSYGGQGNEPKAKILLKELKNTDPSVKIEITYPKVGETVVID